MNCFRLFVILLMANRKTVNLDGWRLEIVPRKREKFQIRATKEGVERLSKVTRGRKQIGEYSAVVDLKFNNRGASALSPSETVAREGIAEVVEFLQRKVGISKKAVTKFLN